MAQRYEGTYPSSQPPGGLGKSKSEASRDRVYHTVTACVRCRQRKTRCDPGLPRCVPCERNNARCEYFDAAKNRMISRTYITSLQASVRRLQAELAAIEQQDDHPFDPEITMRSAGLIKFSENDESRFLGPSSGIAVTRLVMELAKRNTASKSIKDVVSDVTAKEIKKKFDDEKSKPTSKVYPLISSVAAPVLPAHDVLEKLVDIYMAKAQYMLPLLHEPTFRDSVRAVYEGARDATINFQARLVIAISMQKLDTQYAGLADSYYLAALPYLEAAVRKMDLSTLQCFALIAQYSLLTPTRTAAYWVVGLAIRLCQELGICKESTIQEYPPGNRFNALEVDMRRRLFWIITSMEFGLAHSLGRPSAFAISVDHIDVEFFALCDDRFITANGLLPGNYPVMKKCISVHFFKMRLLQAEVRRTLYLKKREAPLNDQDPWFVYMQNKIDDWVQDCPKNDEGSGFSEIWFHARRNTIIIFMYRPSPQIPTPSPEAAQQCYDAATFNIDVMKRQLETKIVDLTWIFTQTLFMLLNTILWSLSYAEIRQQHPHLEVSIHVNNALTAIDYAADRWPGVQSARQLYDNLIWGCFKAYENDSSCAPSLYGQSPTSTQEAPTSPSQSTSFSPTSTHTAPPTGPTSPASFADSYAAFSQPDLSPAAHADTFVDPLKNSVSGKFQQLSFESYSPPSVTQPTSQKPTVFPTNPNGPAILPAIQPAHSLPAFNLDFGMLTGSLPIPASQNWGSNPAMAPSNRGYFSQGDVDMDRPWLGSFGDEYSRFTQQMYFPSSQQLRPLSEQQQTELLATLEQDQLPDVSKLVSESTTFYRAHLV